jgi:hypothetical protein
MTLIKNTNKTYGQGQETLYTSGRNVNEHSQFKAVWIFLKKLKIEI